MNETQKRIAEYKKALPKLKERVAAAVLLVIIAFAMATTSTFAWLVLSRAPEMTGASTTIAANGNLEIALASGSLKLLTAPGASAVGDSNKDLLERNITWGNLINLADPAYGLDELVLRPAMLNYSSLGESPLYGAIYGKDGRIETLSSNFAYASWVPAQNGLPGYFTIPEEGQAGVRVIASTTTSAEGYWAQYNLLKASASSLNGTVGTKYISLTQNSKWMDSLASVMGAYMTGVLNDSDETIASADLMNLHEMLVAFCEIMHDEANAMAEMANLQTFINEGKPEISFTKYTAETLFDLVGASDSETNTKLKNRGLQITNLYQYKQDYDNILKYTQKIGELKSSSCKASEIEDIMNGLVTVSSCTLNGKTISQLAADKSSAISAVLGGSNNQAVINNGLIYRFEQRIGTNMSVKTKIPVKYIISTSVTATISTSAAPPSWFSADEKYAVDKNEATADDSGRGRLEANDPYGLALDFWIRTNAQNAYLTLQGNVLTETTEVPATGTDMNNNTVNLYTATVSVTDENGDAVTYTVDAYKSGNQWYTTDHTKITPDFEPTQKVVEVETVIGYEGDNRVWEGSPGLNLSVNSTTQGSGSCYVYYADTPEDQARSLELLKSMRVAFIDAYGNLLAEAKMDTEHFYADSGKVIVPLVLNVEKCIDLGTNAMGETTYAITALEQNVPMLVTAIIYLDGTDLGNGDVLASSSIQGQFNIQFGSNIDLNAIKDEALASKELIVSAQVSNTSFDYDTADGDMTSRFTVNVQGTQPKTMTAWLIRSINSSQGTREAKITFTDQGDGTWVADYTFTLPGTYTLRSIQLDGVEKDLTGERPEVKVAGFALSSLTWEYGTQSETMIMTANPSVSEEIYLQFAAKDEGKLPRSVKGRFLRTGDGAAVNVDFSNNNGTWTGTANFLSSGEYILQYLVLTVLEPDGKLKENYYEIPTDMQKKATLYLGMKVEVYTGSKTSFLYKGDDHQDSLIMQVKIMDNTDVEMKGLSNVNLYYASQSSALDENGLHAELTWNGSTGYYEGEFTSKIGMYHFNRVTVGEHDDKLTNATVSPSFFIVSPVPPTFNKGTSQPFYYTPTNGAAKLSVTINDCEAAIVSAILLKDGEEYEVQGTLETATSYWTFPIPTGSTNDGVWRIKEIHISGVYAEDGTAYTAENPLIFVMGADEAGVETKVVSTLNVSFATTETIEASGSFLQEQSIFLPKLTITDGSGDVLPNISDITVKYKYSSENSKAFGGYEINTNAWDDKMADFSVTLINDGSGKYFVQDSNAPAKLSHAGTYTLASIIFTFKAPGAAGETYVPLNGSDVISPKIEIKSVAPSVTITGISPTGSNPTKITYTTKSLSLGRGTEPTFTATGNQTSSYSAYEATLYAVATADNSTQRHGSFTQPKLTITVAGVDSSCSVSMTLPAGSASAVTFSRTGNGAITQTLGSVAQINSWKTNWGIYTHTLSAYYGHGTGQKIETMTVVKNGVTYTVYLENPLTINNPSSVNQ